MKGKDGAVVGVFFMRIYDGNECVPYVGARYWMEAGAYMKITGLD